jgi:hypothetical protein
MTDTTAIERAALELAAKTGLTREQAVEVLWAIAKLAEWMTDG